MPSQDSIQCYTQNQIASAAQATGRDALHIGMVREKSAAVRQAFEDNHVA